MRHLPNLITIIRLLLIIPISLLIYEGKPGYALALFLIASLSDGLDGYLARRFSWVSAFGTLIDPAADKLLLLVTTITLTLLGYFPEMLFFLMVAKDLAVLGGLIVYTLLAGFPLISPIWIGKVTTAIQLLLLGLIIIDLTIMEPVLADAVIPGMYWLVAVFTLLDGCSYIWLWTSRLIQDSRWTGANNT